MKDVDRKSLERLRPQVPALKAINHCLACLFEDGQRTPGEAVAENLTYEELIGTLLLARDVAEEATMHTGSYD